MSTSEAEERLKYIESLYHDENLERQRANEVLVELGIVVPEAKKAPFEKLYFNGDMLAQYEPCMDSLQSLIDSEGEDDDAWRTFEQTFGKFLDFSWCSKWDGTKYDIVFYGASGYTGYLVCEYLKRVSLKRTPEKFTIAFAGRTPSKCAALRDRSFKGTPFEDIPIIQASYDDPVSMIDLARYGRTILNLAGPYLLTPGEILLDACCHSRTHYFDINGEIPWWYRCLNLDARARASGTIIVPSAAPVGGMPDMMQYILHKQIKQKYGSSEELARSIAYGTAGGSSGTSGGTLASRAGMNAATDFERKVMADPFCLGGFIPERDRNGLKEVQIKQGTGEVIKKIRREDQDSFLTKISEDKINNLWRAPHTYSFFDTRIVRRTNALLADHLNAPYGRNFNYTMFVCLPPMQAGELAKGNFMATAAVGGVAAEKAALEAAGKYFGQGQGPALESLNDAWMCFQVWVESVSGHRAKCSICGNDPYFETARCSIEACMVHLFEYDSLPIKGGVLTLASNAAEPTMRRVIASGLKWKPDSFFDWAEMGPAEDMTDLA
jgi:short subunit dehydrogenase-like uncharacterized protein